MGAQSSVLEQELRAQVKGEVRFDAGSRAMYAAGGSNYRHVPIGVVVPVDEDDAAAAVGVCHEHGAPLLPRGGGTSLAGQCANVAVVIDFSKYMRAVVDIDADRRVARVQPGLVLDSLQAAAAPLRLMFGPDPSTHDHCTLGGMIGNNSCGVHSVLAGRTADNVEELDVLTYDGLRLRVGRTPDVELESIIAAGGRRGEIYAGLRRLRDNYAELIRARYPRIPRRVSGYNLDELLPERGFNVARALVGTEGTCVTVLGATVRLVPSPPARSLVVIGFPDVCTAADHTAEVLEFGPIGLEGIDDVLVEDMRVKGLHTGEVGLLPDGGGWLLVEFGGDTKEEADAAAHKLMEHLGRADDPPSTKLYDDPHEEHQVWLIRESGLGATALVPGKPLTWEGWEDAAVPPERLGGYLREFRALLNRYDYACALYGHFGGGCVHTRIDFDLRTADGIRTFRSFVEEAADLVVAYGGSLSGEHGDGQSRAELLPKMFGPELVAAFGEFKRIWDPANRMNPGRVVDPLPIIEGLRLGTDYRPPEPATHFRFPDDDGNFARATLRCVGVGKCRRESGGVMCPSYMVTHEEADSTRGRARLLFEMLQGDPVTKGWRSPEVRDALDLCLACKGCKADCPVNVDMATYKAEFLSHFYAGRLRPRAHYSMGLLPLVAPLGGRAPRAVNALTQTPGVRTLVKWAGGIAPERQLPRFARQSFRRWFEEREGGRRGGDEVLLWPDTFTDSFHPEIGRAAVEVLETAGYSVTIPDERLCCGLPMISTGMLRTAKRMLRRTVDALSPRIRAGVPLVGLEPSCTAVFRHDLVELFPHDQDAQRLAGQTRTLAELLERWEPPELRRSAIVQTHCHQHAVLGFDADRALMGRLGLDADVLDSGCCGLAGNFGFERGHYDVSLACAERVLLPAVRSASPETLVLADGFSCRTQIEQASGRRALHLAEVLAIGCRTTMRDVSPGRPAR